MADISDIYIASMQESWTQARHCEEQRSTISNLILTIAASIHGVFAFRGISRETFVLAIFLVVLGIYGLIVCWKLYERNRYHVKGAQIAQEELEKLFPQTPQMSVLLGNYKTKHEKEDGWIARARLYHMWGALHAMIAFLGGVYVAYILFLISRGQP